MVVEEVLGVVIVGTVFAMVAVFRTVITVLVPALFVHGVLTLHHNLVACLEGGLAVVARLLDGLAGPAHIVASIGGDMFLDKQSVADVGHQKLHDEPHQCDDEQTQHGALYQHESQTEAIDDDGRIDAAFDNISRERCEDRVGLGVVEIHRQLVLVAAIDLEVGVDKLEQIAG